MFRPPSLALLLALAMALLLAATPGSAAPGPWRSIGPEGNADQLMDLRFPDPGDGNRLLGLTRDALWVSRDGGRSWRDATATLPEIGNLELLDVDPFDPAHWLLLARGGSSPLDLLAETRDAGRTWTVRTLAGEYFKALRFDAHVRDLVLVASGIEIRRSRDGFRTWDTLPPPQPCCLQLHQAQPEGRFLVSIGRKLWSLAAATGDWRLVSAETPEEFRILVADRGNSQTLYAASYTSVFRSADGGGTFVPLPTGGTPPFYRILQSARNPDHLAILDVELLHLSADRGATWTAEPFGTVSYGKAAAFDPAAGELLFSDDEKLFRRRPDGSREGAAIRGLYGLPLADVFLDAPRGQLYVLAPSGRILRRDADLRWSRLGQATCRDVYQLTLAPWDPSRLFVACSESYQLSFDGGASFLPPVPVHGVNAPLPPRFLFGPGDPGRIYLLRPGADLAVFGEAITYAITGAVDAVVHPDAAESLLVSSFYPSLTLEDPDRGYLYLWGPDPLPIAQLDHWSGPGSLRGLGQDPQDPDHVVAVDWDGGATRVSFDRGVSWQDRGGIDPSRVGMRALIDPNDGNHLVVGGGAPLSESRDGAASWQVAFGTEGSTGLAFDAASNLYVATPGGLLRRSPETEPCSSGDANFCARQNRFELTVEWKTPNGATGVAKKVETGSQESGLFYFFDPNNWELLVKVLDGCGLNQRFWVFTAGTTDVEYLLKVEDRFTGKIRTYWNAPGRAAEAVADTDAFATCSEPSPAGAALAAAKAATGDGDGDGGNLELELVGGRFRVAATWTDFAGQEGQATPVPLVSANSGLFWFFSPDNWEVLIKVLDGCAINGHYWVLAAATTDVGYELRVAEPARGREKVYRNPVGVPSPAQLDLQAFSCSS